MNVWCSNDLYWRRLLHVKAWLQALFGAKNQLIHPAVQSPATQPSYTRIPDTIWRGMGPYQYRHYAFKLSFTKQFLHVLSLSGLSNNWLCQLKMLSNLNNASHQAGNKMNIFQTRCLQIYLPRNVLFSDSIEHRCKSLSLPYDHLMDHLNVSIALNLSPPRQ